MAGTGGQRVGGLYVQLSTRGADSVERDMDRVQRSMHEAEDRGRSLNETLHGLEGAFAAAAVGAGGLAVGLGALVYRYGRIESQFSRVQEQTQATTGQMEAMRDKAEDIGQEMPVSIRGAADALYQLTSAGLTASQATMALEGTTNLAAIGQLKMADAATTTAGVLNAFNLEASRASNVADMIAAAASSSTADIQGMADAIRGAAGAAEQLGVSAQEVSAFVSTLTAAGIEASQAGTSVENALSALVNPSEEARTALSGVGLAVSDFYTQSGELKNMAAVLGTLKSNLSGLSEAQQQAVLSDVFGDEGGRAMNRAISRLDEYRDSIAETSRAEVAGGIDRLGGLSDEELSQRQQDAGFNLQSGSTRGVLEQFRNLAESEGLSQDELSAKIALGLNVSPRAADLLAGELVSGTEMGKIVTALENTSTASDMAESSMNSLAGQVRRLGGALDTFLYNVYEGASGPLSVLVGGLTTVAEWLAEHETLAQAAGVAIVGLTLALSALALELGYMYAQAMIANYGIGGLVASTTTLQFASKAASGAIWLMTASLADVRGALAATQAAQWLTAASSMTLSGAYTALTGAIGGATTALYAFWTALGPIGWAILAIIGLFVAWKTGLLDFIGLGGEADAVIESIMWALGGLVDVLGGVIGATEGTLGPLGILLGNLVQLASLPIVLPIKATGVALRYLGDSAEMALSPIDTMVGTLEWAIGVFERVSQGPIWLRAALMSIPGIGMLYWLYELTSALGGAEQVFNDLGHAAGFAAGVFEGLYDIGMSVVGTVLDPIEQKIDDVAEAFETAAEKAKSFFDSLDPRGEGQSWGDWINPLPDNWSSGNAPNARKQGKKAGQATAEGYASGTKDGEAWIKNAVGGAMDTVSSFLPSSDAERGPLSNLTAQGRALPETLASGIRDGASATGNATGSLARTLASIANPWGQIMPTIAPDTTQSPISPTTRAGSSDGGKNGQSVTAGGNSVSFSPTFEIEIGGEDIGNIMEDVDRKMEQAKRDLQRQLETELFKFATGQ